MQSRSQSRTHAISLKTGGPKSALLEFDSCDQFDVNLFRTFFTSSEDLFLKKFGLTALPVLASRYRCGGRSDAQMCFVLFQWLAALGAPGLASRFPASVRLRLDAQPRHLDRDGSCRGCICRRSHQSRDPPPAQNRAHGFKFPESSQKNGPMVWDILHLKFGLWL